MDWMNRSTQGAQPANQPVGSPVNNSVNNGRRKSGGKLDGMRFVTLALMISGAVLLLAVIASLVFGAPKSEAGNLDKDKYQAVFLNGGQVYFGKVQDLNDKFMTLDDIYYLRVNQQVQPDQQGANAAAAANDVSLVKLGCELHGPEDRMVINREMVIFWENLKTDGQVAKAVEEYVKQNPDGQKCDTTAEQGADAGNSNATPTQQATPAANGAGAAGGTQPTQRQP